MDKKHGGASGQGSQGSVGHKAAADRRPTGKGSEDAGELRDLCTVEPDGTICFGDSCVQIRVKPGERDVRVKIDRSSDACNGDTKRLVDLMLETVVQGGSTVYETKSEDARQRQE